MIWNVSVGVRLTIDYDDIEADDREEAELIAKERAEEAEGLKQCIEHEHASFMETFREYAEKCDKLTEENERLQAEITHLEGHREADIKAFKTLRADTVRKMADMFRSLVVVYLMAITKEQALFCIDQIAKEMEGDNEN